jgi:membrane protein
VVVLLWVYYSAQIFLFGAQFTKVYARRYGSSILPSRGAVWRVPPEIAAGDPSHTHKGGAHS